jgi:hypothetical protein
MPIEGVLPTTNHLESFNAVLKTQHLPQWQRSGTRLRIDFLILILITKILPGIFTLRQSLCEYKQWLRTRFSDGPRGLDPATFHKPSRPISWSSSDNSGICWWPRDEKKDDAKAIVKLQRIYDIRQKLNMRQHA